MFSNYSLFFFQAEDGIRDATVTGVQTCALPIYFVIPWSFDFRHWVFLFSKVPTRQRPQPRSEERRVGKSVNLGGRCMIKKKTSKTSHAGWIYIPTTTMKNYTCIMITIPFCGSDT